MIPVEWQFDYRVRYSCNLVIRLMIANADAILEAHRNIFI